jgi:hypothetical protein
MFSYTAPFDLLKDDTCTQYDIVVSISTLEHIPRSLVDNFIVKMFAYLSIGGVSIHYIDLTDHYDHKNNPLGFLADTYPNNSDDTNADTRGNRIRAYEWFEYLQSAGIESSVIINGQATINDLPKALAKQYLKVEHSKLLPTAILAKSVKVGID